jgi:hypothetical protein
MFFGIKFDHNWTQCFLFLGFVAGHFFSEFSIVWRAFLDSFLGTFECETLEQWSFVFLTNFSKIRNVRIKKEHAVENLSDSYRKTSGSS